ncbi:hypothetical protein AGMMS49944_26000 [Spirochaetia bacterium]|nr:hypothetical protein AGMMS49944_26000 [Spirochaetia bacterium]
MKKMEIDPIKAKYFYANNDEKIKLNWFCYEYAWKLYNEIRKSIKLKKYQKQNDQGQIVQFCVYFSKEMKKSIFQKLGGLTNETVFYEEYVENYYPKNSKAMNMRILEAATKAWDRLLSGCGVCPTRCISEMYEKCILFDQFDEEEHLMMDSDEKYLRYSKEELFCIESHIQKHFGNIDSFINGRGTNNEDFLKIDVIKPTGVRNYWTLVTIGIGAYRMNIPKEYVGVRNRTELVMYIQPDWNFNADVLNTPDAWPVEMLFRIAQIPIVQKGFLCRGLSVDFTSKGESTFIGNTNYTSVIIVPYCLPDEDASVCVLPNTEAVGFSNVFPLYQDEVEFYRSTSIDNMVRKFGTLFKQPVTGERKNLCQGMLKLTAKK